MALDYVYLASTTPVQLFNFAMFMASMVIFINNTLDYRYRYSNLDSLGDFTSIVDDLIHALASIVVMFFSISSPFEDDDLFEISLLGNEASTSPVAGLFRVLFFTGLCFVSSSSIVEDPNVLFTEIQTFLTSNDADSDVTELTLDLLEPNGFGVAFSKAVALSKAFCFLAAVLYALGIMLNNPCSRRVEVVELEVVDRASSSYGNNYSRKKQKNRSKQTQPVMDGHLTTQADHKEAHRVQEYYVSFLSTILPRAIIGLTLAVNCYALYDINTFTGVESEATRRIKQLATVGASSSVTYNSTTGLSVSELDQLLSLQSVDSTLQSVLLFFNDQFVESMAVVLMCVVAAYILLFYRRYTHSLPVITCVSSFCIAKLEEVSSNDDLFTIIMLVAIFNAVSTCAYFFSFGKVDDLLRFIPNLFYKVGLILCIIPLPLLFISYSHTWLEITMEPAGITQNMVEVVDSVDSQIMDTYTDLAEIVRKVNPCIRPLSVTVDLTNVDSREEGLQQIEDSLTEMRQETVKTGTFFNLEDCIQSENPYAYRWREFRKIRFLKRRACSNVESREDTMRSELIEELDQQLLEAQMSGKNLTDAAFEDPYYIDKFCSQIKCNSITAITATLFIMTLIPFVGTAASIMSKLVDAGYKVYRLANKVFKKIPNLLKIRSKTQKLKRRLKALSLSQSKRTVNATKTIAWLFFPIIVTAGIALTLIMLRRQRPHITVKGKESIFIDKLALGLKVGIGLALPMLLSDFAMYVVMLYFPEFLEIILDALPDSLVSATLELDVGYEALQYAYLVSFAGNACIVVGAVSYIYTEFAIALLTLPRRIFWFVWNYIIVGTVHFLKWFFQTALVRFIHTLGYGVLFLIDLTRVHNNNRRVQTSAAFIRFGTDLKENIAYKLRIVGQFLLTLSDLRIQYLQPLLFSIIPIPIIIKATYQSDYVEMAYIMKPEAVQTATEIQDTTFTSSSVEDITDEFNDAGCGILDRFASILTKIANMDVIFEERIVPFKDDFLSMISQLDSLKTRLLEMIYVDSFPITYPIAHTTENIVVFAVPVGCTLLLFIVWILTALGSESKAFIQVLRLFRLDAKTSMDDFVGVVAALIFGISVTFIIIHIIVGSMIEILAETNIPFVSFQVSLGNKHYLAIIAHGCGMLSAIAHYTNIQVPPISTIRY